MTPSLLAPDALSVRKLVLSGRHHEAAELAEHISRQWDEPKRALVRELSYALNGLGDRYRKRGRPKLPEVSNETIRRTIAVAQYRSAVCARQLLDGDDVSIDDLINLTWHLHLRPSSVPEETLFEEWPERVGEVFSHDISGIQRELKIHAKQFLGRLHLERTRVARRNYKAVTLRKISRRWDVPESALRRQLAQ
jgi:hypothetical protein